MGEMVTIPAAEYERLKAASADLKDLRVFDRVTADLASGREELLPATLVARMVDGENPLRVWREHRGMSQSGLASAASVNRVQINDIEAGRRTGSVETLRKLAGALNISLDDLV